MQTRTKQTIAVVGATGAQGGGLVRAIAEAGNFNARAITRNKNSDAAKALLQLGAEVVEADVDDQASLERAFDGADAAFCVTFYWAHMSPERETIQAQNLAKAAKAAKLRHAIWSTLEDTRRFVPVDDKRMPTLMGHYKVPHYDVKGAANQFFAELGVPTTYLNTSFYWDNFIHFGMGPKRGPDGVLALTLPMADKKLPGIASDDIGRAALAIFSQSERFIGKSVAIAGEHLTGAEMAKTFSDVLGQPVRYNAVPPDVYRSFGFPGADDLGNMFQFKAEFEREYCGARDLSEVRRLVPGLQTFNVWLKKHAAEIPLD